MAIFITNAAAIVGLDAILDLVDAGTPPGLLKIYDSTAPADADTALSGNTLLATLTFSSTAFDGATDGTGIATADASTITPDTSVDSTGTASFFRITNAAGTVIIQGTCGGIGSGADLELNTTSLVIGGTTSVSAMTFNLPELGT